MSPEVAEVAEVAGSRRKSSRKSSKSNLFTAHLFYILPDPNLLDKASAVPFDGLRDMDKPGRPSVITEDIRHIVFDGLRDMDKPGRPSVITEDIRHIVDGDLRRQPRELGYSQNLWDGKLLSHHLKKRKGLRLGVRQCQRLFHKFGFRRRKPRPVIASADPVAQAQYKKTPTHGKES
ncbi:MAG: winged helix-turn-helix domain-containing protein [Candidatus Omnitrophica bacterium]|nr:winged helix-turn-helix domain-containing protein [Candidatus Omnitrophota bacterium]